MIRVWEFSMESEAEAEAERRIADWEEKNNDFICRVFMESKGKREV